MTLIKQAALGAPTAAKPGQFYHRRPLGTSELYYLLARAIRAPAEVRSTPITAASPTDK